MLFDSHAHLDDPQFDPDREAVIRQLMADGVSYLVDVGADMSTSEQAVAIANQYDFIYASVGFHPNDAQKLNDETEARLIALSKNPKVVALGETGLDYYYDDVPKAVQKAAFVRQITLANRLHLPLIIHNRDAHGDLVDILKAHRPESAIIHCFSGSAETAKILAGMGYYISFSGTVTFKNAAKVRDAALAVPDDLLLIETDCPYLAPEPVRGTRNYSGNVRYTAQKLAQLRGTTFERLAAQTMANAKRVYQLEF